MRYKGQGFVPTNSTREKISGRPTIEYYEKLMSLNQNVTYKILDTADYIVPPNEYNSIFIMSNYIQTLQTQGVCDEVIILPFLLFFFVLFNSIQ